MFTLVNSKLGHSQTVLTGPEAEKAAAEFAAAKADKEFYNSQY